MNTASWALLALAALVAIGNWIGVATGRQRLIYCCKPATLILLIAVACTLDPVHSDVRTWFVVALVLSLVGDVLLMLPRDFFVAGLGAFLLGHLAYIVGLNLHSDGRWIFAIPILLVVALSAVRLIGGIRRNGHDKLLVPVFAYVVVIAVMVASAAASGNSVALAGAILFMASDGLIGEIRFVQPHRWGPVAIISSYHVGQVLLVISLTT